MHNYGKKCFTSKVPPAQLLVKPWTFLYACMRTIYSVETNTIGTIMVKSVLFPKSRHTELQVRCWTFSYTCMRTIYSTETITICIIMVKVFYFQSPTMQNCTLNLGHSCRHVCERSTPLKQRRHAQLW